MFDITQHIDIDHQGRAQCPSCLLDGKQKKNLSVSIEGESKGAYKCHRGCTTDQIRAAIGAEKPRSLPPKATNQTPAKKVTVTLTRVKEATERLLKHAPALQWLNERGITLEMARYYRLGLTRAKVGDSTKPNKFAHLDAISIAIATADHNAYFQKKRVRPWVDDDQQPDGYKTWSQYGIPAMVYTTWAPEKPRETWLCEGEWDAIALGWAVRNSLFKSDVQVSCFTCGAGNVPNEEALAQLKGEEVITFYDWDAPGEKGSLKVQESLKSRCRRAQVPNNLLDKCPDGYDVSDALNDGLPLERFSAAAAASTVWQRPPDDNPLRERMVINDDMLARAADYTDWLVDDILTADELFLLAASPRAGKSLMAFTLSLAIATGGKFLGRTCAQGAVIYIRCEDSETKAKEREMKQGWGEGLPVYWLDKFKLSELPHLEQLVEEVGARLVVFDTLSRIRDAGISESSAEMSQLLEPVQEMCKRQRCAGLLVHHTGKVNLQNAGDIDIFDTIRGSSAIRATCRGTLIIAAGEQNWRLAVENGWGKLDLQILLDHNTLNWKLLGNWTAPNVDLNQKDRVLEFLRKVGSAHIEDIHKATNLPKASLYQVLRRLQSDDIVLKTGNQRNSVYTTTQVEQVEQLNTLFNSSNVDTESISSPLEQTPEQGHPPEKVIVAEESDQNFDHFLGSPPTPHNQETVQLEPQTHAGQGIQSLTTVEHELNKPEKVIKSDQKWLFWEPQDTLVKLIRKGRKTHLVKVSGAQREQRVPVEQLVEPPADRFNVSGRP